VKQRLVPGASAEASVVMMNSFVKSGKASTGASANAHEAEKYTYSHQMNVRKLLAVFNSVIKQRAATSQPGLGINIVKRHLQHN
jgi:hypothetical protein